MGRMNSLPVSSKGEDMREEGVGTVIRSGVGGVGVRVRVGAGLFLNAALFFPSLSFAFAFTFPCPGKSFIVFGFPPYLPTPSVSPDTTGTLILLISGFGSSSCLARSSSSCLRSISSSSSAVYQVSSDPSKLLALLGLSQFKAAEAKGRVGFGACFAMALRVVVLGRGRRDIAF